MSSYINKERDFRITSSKLVHLEYICFFLFFFLRLGKMGCSGFRRGGGDERGLFWVAFMYETIRARLALATPSLWPFISCKSPLKNALPLSLITKFMLPNDMIPKAYSSHGLPYVTF